MSIQLTEIDLLAQPDHCYMNADQLAFFKKRLQDRMTEVRARIEGHGETLRGFDVSADPCDTASNEAERRNTLGMLARDSNELVEIGAALERIRAEDYGYCEMSGEPIGLQRLLANPSTKYSVESMRVREARTKHQHQSYAFG